MKVYRSSRKLTSRNAWEKYSAFDLLNTIILIIIALVMLFPFYNSVILSFNDGKDAVRGGIYFWPRKPTFENFAKVLRNDVIGQAAMVSIARTIIGTTLGLVVTSMFAYAASKPYLMYRRFYLILLVIAMYFHGGLIATFLLIRNAGLLNSFWVYVLPGAFNVFYAQVFISFFKGHPEELSESAKIDGANNFVIFTRIILPISIPVFAAIGLFVAINHWNSWYDNMLYVQNKELMTLSFMFVKMILAQQYLESAASQSSNPELSILAGVNTTSLQLAAMVVSTTPIMIVYPFLQKYFVKGVMIGSIKG